MKARFDGSIKRALFKDLKCGDCFCTFSKGTPLDRYPYYSAHIKLNDNENRNTFTPPCSLSHYEPDTEVIIPAKAELIIEGLGDGYCH